MFARLHAELHGDVHAAVHPRKAATASLNYSSVLEVKLNTAAKKKIEKRVAVLKTGKRGKIGKKAVTVSHVQMAVSTLSMRMSWQPYSGPCPPLSEYPHHFQLFAGSAKQLGIC